MERSLVIIKPDGVQRGLIGEIISRFEHRGLKMAGAKFLQVNLDLAQAHYAVHEGKPFYEPLIKFITSSPVMAMVWEGPGAISAIRQMVGATRSLEAAPGTIRQDYALVGMHNLIHASDSVENGEKEIALWFNPKELVEWERDVDKWIFD